MITIEKSNKHSHCNSCGKQGNLKDIKISITGDGATAITLCDKCRDDLYILLKIEGIK